MTRTRKLTLIGIGSAVLVTTLAALAWWVMSQPLYEPGMVRAGKNLRASLEPPLSTPSAGYWLVEPDIRLAYKAHGQGRPILVVHGGPAIPIHTRPAGLERLESDYTFYYYDQRGCGDSTRPFDRFESSGYYGNMTRLEQTLGIGAQVADIERIRRLLGQDKLIVLGHSFGGLLAAMYAAEFPERVDALVLVAPSGAIVLPDEGVGFFGEVRHRLPPAERPAFDRFLGEYLDFGAVFTRSESDLASLHRRFGDYFLAASGESPRNREPGDKTDIGGWMVQAVYFSMGKRHDYRAALRRVHAPVLVVHGEDDLVPVRVSQMYVDCFPNARLHVIRRGGTPPSRAGHFMFADQPQAFADAVGRFLRDRR